jgi:hypothetical protein
MSAAQSGMMTIATAIGALAMKGLAGRVLRRFGFRTSLIFVGILATVGYAACGLFRPDWPLPAVFAVMAASGFLMSLQFTAYNTIAYDEIEPHRMSQATSFYSTIQHLNSLYGYLRQRDGSSPFDGNPRSERADLCRFLGGVLDGNSDFAAGDLRQCPLRPACRRGNAAQVVSRQSQALIHPRPSLVPPSGTYSQPTQPSYPSLSISLKMKP